ncbi:hypothetical protein D3C76_1554110 [compost metagenome]
MGKRQNHQVAVPVLQGLIHQAARLGSPWRHQREKLQVGLGRKAGQPSPQRRHEHRNNIIRRDDAELAPRRSRVEACIGEGNAPRAFQYLVDAWVQ